MTPHDSHSRLFWKNELQAVDAVSARLLVQQGLIHSLARWDPGRIRVLHPQPLDTALLALPKRVYILSD